MFKRLRHLFKKKCRSDKPVFIGEQVPVNQSREVENHRALVDKHFGFLVREHDFQPPVESWDSREFHMVFSSQGLEIGAGLTAGTLPWVYVRRRSNGPGEAQVHNVAGLDDTDWFRELFARRNSRMEPKTQRYLKRISQKNVYDRTELDEDYETWGQFEHDDVLRRCAALLKRHPSILEGDPSALPSPSPSS